MSASARRARFPATTLAPWPAAAPDWYQPGGRRLFAAPGDGRADQRHGPLHGRPPSPGAWLPEVGGRSGRRAGQRRGLEVGQRQQRRRLPYARETAVISTHDWKHSSLAIARRVAPDLGSHLSAGGGRQRTSHNRPLRTGQVFLRNYSKGFEETAEIRAGRGSGAEVFGAKGRQTSPRLLTGLSLLPCQASLPYAGPSLFTALDRQRFHS